MVGFHKILIIVIHHYSCALVCVCVCTRACVRACMCMHLRACCQGVCMSVHIVPVSLVLPTFWSCRASHNRGDPGPKQCSSDDVYWTSGSSTWLDPCPDKAGNKFMYLKPTREPDFVQLQTYFCDLQSGTPASFSVVRWYVSST